LAFSESKETKPLVWPLELMESSSPIYSSSTVTSPLDQAVCSFEWPAFVVCYSWSALSAIGYPTEFGAWLSDPLPAADVAWEGSFLERSVERVAVRQGGHWPCGCSHIYLILFQLITIA
jgi:hypothetical protein